MPCYSKIQTVLLDVSSIEAAATQLGMKVQKHAPNSLTVTRGYESVTLFRTKSEDRFQAQGDTSLLTDLVPVYAKKQLVKFAKSKGYTISQGSDATEYILTKYE